MYWDIGWIMKNGFQISLVHKVYKYKFLQIEIYVKFSDIFKYVSILPQI